MEKQYRSPGIVSGVTFSLQTIKCKNKSDVLISNAGENCVSGLIGC